MYILLRATRSRNLTPITGTARHRPMLTPTSLTPTSLTPTSQKTAGTHTLRRTAA